MSIRTDSQGIVCQRCGFVNIYNTLSERLWSRIDKNRDCWEWVGPLNLHGYGQLKYRNRMYQAHRLAWELTNGPIPDNLFVCHKCDNPVCCRPDHLFLGTHADNMADMVAKGRARKGSDVYVSKLEEIDIPIIRELHAQGAKVPSIARKYNVKSNAIRRIIEGKTWKHIVSDVGITVLPDEECRYGMTETLVANIRADFATGMLSYNQLAKKYNISLGTIHDVVKRRTWKHIP